MTYDRSHGKVENRRRKGTAAGRLVQTFANSASFRSNRPRSVHRRRSGGGCPAPFALDEKRCFERVYLEGLRQKISDVLAQLPNVALRQRYLDPGRDQQSDRHHRPACGDLADRIGRTDALAKERAELERYAVFSATLAPWWESALETPDLDFHRPDHPGPEMANRLREALSRIHGLEVRAADRGGCGRPDGGPDHRWRRGPVGPDVRRNPERRNRFPSSSSPRRSPRCPIKTKKEVFL